MNTLHPDTLAAMREVFAGQVCCRCLAQAERLCMGRFFCGQHFPKGSSAATEISLRRYRGPKLTHKE